MTGNLWEVTTAVATVFTGIIAAFVFWEARAIRQTDWLMRQNQAWNDLCNTLSQADPQSRIPPLVLGEAIQPPLSCQDSFLLMTYFNVVSNEYNAYRARAIKRRYVIHSFSTTARIASINQAWIFDFLKENGYDGDFRRAIAILVAIGEDLERRDMSLRHELRAASRLGKFCGPRGRAWLRRRLDNHQIDSLCGVPAS